MPASHLVGGEGDGMSFSYEWFRFERMMVAARCLGAAERLIEEATAFARDRIVSGEPLLQRQLVAGHAGRQRDRAVRRPSMVYETARSIDGGIDLKVAHARCAMVKLYASEMAGRVADRVGADLRRPRLHARERG